jgi:hypothetical protein
MLFNQDMDPVQVNAFLGANLSIHIFMDNFAPQNTPTGSPPIYLNRRGSKCLQLEPKSH